MQEEIKTTDMELDKWRHRGKTRKQWGTGHTGKKLSISRGSQINSLRERTWEERWGVEQRESLKTETGRWVEGDLEMHFSQAIGKKVVWEE